MYKNLEKIIYDLQFKNEKVDDIENECKHDLREISGFNTCIVCGIVCQQLFKTVSDDDYTFLDDKPVRKSLYKPIREIRINFLDYIISSQKQISDEEYETIHKYLVKNYMFSSLPKHIKSSIKECGLSQDLFNSFYNRLKNNKISEASKLTSQNIQSIFSLCEKFIIYAKKNKIKNINKKAIIYNIVKHNFNILLDDYICDMNRNIITRYKNYYLDMLKKEGVKLS